jgi:single-stranded-DNA-specific exonuclease
MGEGRHARFNLHSGAHRAVGVAFGRSRLGVGEEDSVDAAVRLEVNRWNGSIEPRVVLREVFPREEGLADAPAVEAEAWWERFEAELREPPEGFNRAQPVEGAQRRPLRSLSSPAALLSELGSCTDGNVLAVVADVEARAELRGRGAELADGAALRRRPGLAAGFTHVVLVDPPAFPEVESAARLGGEVGGFLHLAWGEAEHRFAVAALQQQFAARWALAELYRDLREAGEVSGAELLGALRGSGRRPRGPEAAARGFRVLAELGLVRGEPAAGTGEVGAVSSEKKDLERSVAYRAYGARRQEGLEYLARRKNP